MNLADLYRATNREAEGLDALRVALQASPQNPALLHALGLALVRAKSQPDEALLALEQAANLARENARYGYVHAVALHSMGRREDAIKALQQVQERHPGDRETLAALVSFEQEAGNSAGALAYAEKLMAIMPEDPNLRRLVEELKKRTAAAPR